MSENTPGTLLPLRPLIFDFLLLLNQEQRHGYGLMQEQNDKGGRQVLGPGTLYRTLREMQELGLIKPVNGTDDGSKDRRYYHITPFGRQVASAEASRMASLVGQAKEGQLLG
jgi:DNA-binding PadR family transcriptional regulator